MATNLFQSESKFLERVRIALTNAESHAEIKDALKEFGVDETKFTEGWQVFNRAKEAWEFNKKEETDTRLASHAYSTTYHDLEMKFKRDRDLTLIFCKKDPDTLLQLGVKGRFPSKYHEFFDKVKQFYSGIAINTEIQNRLALIKITPEVVSDCLSKLENLLALRANFDKEMGEAQDATVSKNTVLLELADWMDDFDTLCKVSLYYSPTRLEVLGIVVKS